MHLLRPFGRLLLLLVGIVGLMSAQESVLRLIPYNGQPTSYLNAQIVADTTANNGIPANRVYELDRNGTYLANALFNVDAGKTLRIRAANGAGKRPIIYLYPTGTGANPERPPGYLFQLRGGKLDLRNLSIAGYFEPVDTNFNNVQGGVINTSSAGSSMYIDSCVFSQIAGQHLRTGSATVTVKVTNSIFADMGALSTSNLGAGKGIDLRDVSVDTLILVNNTWVNFQDRVVRHYNFGNPTAGTGALRYFLFDHNTVVNGMSFHGLLSLGSMGPRAIITNNLFIDAFASGEDSADATRQAEWANHGEKYPNGSNRMCWIFTAPNDTTVWTVKNNHYSVSDSGAAFIAGLNTQGVLGEGKPLSWHINGRIGGDSTTAFTKSASPIALAAAPKLMLNLMRWYRAPNGGNKTKNTPSSLWNRALHDIDRHRIAYYTDTLNASYSTSIAAYSGGTGGYPVGDLNWFPARKTAWLADPVSGAEVEVSVPTEFSLAQNYPNPFNPATRIAFTLPSQLDLTLEVFDVLGRKVATLAKGVYPAGMHEVDFDASRLTSGLYVYRLSGGSLSVTRKMMLVK
jgi:hypothetical protein